MRRADRVRSAWLALAALAGSCAPSPVPKAVALVAPVCRASPDGRPTGDWLSDRGIGGTGSASGVQQADRGIGGTGAPIRTADRGIGGTGIIGVVTGFASVCLAGRDVALAPDVSVETDGRGGGIADLRAGQVTAITATDAAGGLRAQRIAIRHEVSGPIESADSNGLLRVAGQIVALTPATWVAAESVPGTWVAVSGLRRLDGTIEATRIDARPPGPVIVHGLLRRENGAWRIDALTLRLPPGVRPSAGEPVTAMGRYQNGVLVVDEIVSDLLSVDPAAYFGVAVTSFVVESFAIAGNGQVRLGTGLRAAAPVGFSASGRNVLQFDRAPGGALRFDSMRSDATAGSRGPMRDAAPTPSRGFEPAPTPNRSFNSRPGGGGSGFRGGPRAAGPGRESDRNGRPDGFGSGQANPGRPARP